MCSKTLLYKDTNDKMNCMITILAWFADDYVQTNKNLHLSISPSESEDSIGTKYKRTDKVVHKLEITNKKSVSNR